MRPDLGRLDAIAEILQIGRFLARGHAWRHRPSGGILHGKCRERRMRVLSAVAVIMLLTGPAYAQMPALNLLQDNSPAKTPEEKEAEATRDKAYKESLKKIPDAKVASDPWGNVRATPAPKTQAAAKPRTKTGSTAN